MSTDRDAADLAALVGQGGVLVLSGAGLSTESGIPDYRGPTGARRRHAPMTYQQFTRDPSARRRYWARSHLGWPLISSARPNAGHAAVAALQSLGLVHGVVTQNVDGLHQTAGASGVLELHGALARVVCLSCGGTSLRADLEARLTDANPGLEVAVGVVNPDGDAEVADADLDGFRVVDCVACGHGPLKPDVVFFGETVPRPRVRSCFDLVDSARSVVVLGSSLTVMSGYRFVLHAVRLGLPVAIVNQGPTRGDERADVRVDACLGDVLPALVDDLALPEARRAAG